MRKISKTGPGYADHRLDQEGTGFFLPQGRLLMAESRHRKYPNPPVLMAALPPEADIQLILVKGAANDPKRTFGDIN